MLFLVGSGVLASLLFSLVVFYEMAEQPFNLLDTVLEEEGTRVVRSLVASPAVMLRERDWQNLGMEQYWLELRDREAGTLLFRSPLAKELPLAPLPSGSVAVVRPQTEKTTDHLSQNRSYQPVLRMLSFRVDEGGKQFLVQIGRPMEKLHEEIWEVVFGLLAGVIFSTLVLSAISRAVAKKILRPVQEMQNLARDISEQNLGQRLPCDKTGDEINELAQTMNRMLDRLQYSFDRQRSFLYATSHELKTPLATIRLAVENIASREPSQELLLMQEDLGKITEQNYRLERLVKDLLLLSSLETQTGLDGGPVDLSALLDSLVEEFSAIAQSRDITLQATIEPNCVVPGDGEKLYRGLVNLFDNAIKFTPEGGRIEIASALQEETVVICLVNTGCGVAESACDEVFTPFFRGEKSRALTYGGFGLGLAIVKKIVALHQGRVTFASGLEQLTTVTLHLPRL